MLALAVGCAESPADAEGDGETTSTPSPATAPSSTEQTAPPATEQNAPPATEQTPDAAVPSPQLTAPDAAAPSTGPAAGPGCPTWLRDCDGDGFAASAEGSVTACTAPAGSSDCTAYTTQALTAGQIDCDDHSAAHHPGAGYALAIPGGNEGIHILTCPPGDPQCVVTSNPDLNCDGLAEPDPQGAEFWLSGHPLSTLTHVCSGSNDCNCWQPSEGCGAHDRVSVRLCARDDPSQVAEFDGSSTLACR